MRILAIGAHPDDIEIGCGGTLLWHRDRGDDVHLLVMTDDLRAGERSAHLRRREAEHSARALGASLTFAGLPDKEVPTLPAIESIESVLNDFSPTLVYVHDPRDSHQDHRITSTAALSASRRERSVLYYKGPSSTDFNNNLYVDIGKYLDTKIELVSHHRSQVQPIGWVDIELLIALARATGHSARFEYAEGFNIERLLFADAYCCMPTSPDTRRKS